MLLFLIKISQTVSIYALRVDELRLVMRYPSPELLPPLLVHLLVLFVSGDRRN